MEKHGRDIDRGHKIAATGEIFLDGGVARSADQAKDDRRAGSGCRCFLVPACRTPATPKYAHGLRIIPVKSFQQALRVLATLPLKG